MNLYEIIEKNNMLEKYHKFINDEGVLKIDYNGSIITLTSEDQFGGEGQGDNYWVIFSCDYKGEKTFYKVTGWYASYSGREFDDYSPVEVKKVPVQRYEWQEV